MEKSQLRQLALDHAQGELVFDDYVRERAELIDAIVDERLAIARSPASGRLPPETRESSAPTVRIQMPTATRSPSPSSPAYVGVGLAVVAVVAALAFVFWPDEAPPPPAPVAAPVAPPKPIEQPEAQQLVTAFVADNNWNEASIEKFLARWQALTQTQRDEARAAPWFRDLTAGLRQEINARHALASLPGGGADRIDGLRLVQFARALELGGQYPDFGDDEHSGVDVHATAAVALSTNTAMPTAVALASGATAATSSVPGITSAGSNATAQPTAIHTVSAARPASDQRASAARLSATPTADTSGEAAMPAGGVEITDPDSKVWFEALPDSHHTLQLFVVTQLDDIRKLQADHPDIALRFLNSPASGGRTIYYVVHGGFADPDAARRAFDRLPAALRKDQEFALVRRIADLRARIAAPPSSPAADMQTNLAVSDTDNYTLQLFVFGQRDNADKLLQQFPELPLWVHHSKATPQEYRVLMGRFADAENARLARDELPAALTAKIGVPVVKRVADPAGPGVSRE